MNIQEHINSWVDAHEEELIADIKRLVAIRSVRGTPEPGMPFGKAPVMALEEALRLCDSYGFITKNYDNYVGTADLCSEETVLDILGHLDIVGEGDGWSTDPYNVVCKDGFLYGRGTSDNKGPVISAIYALRAIKESGLIIKRNARLIMGTDEESGSRDLDHYFKTEKSAPNTFSPDAAFPVCNTEKGSYKPVFSKKWDPQTAVPRLNTFIGGSYINVIPEDANADIIGIPIERLMQLCLPEAEKLGVSLTFTQTENGVRIFAKGKSAHAALPEYGINGLTALLKLISALPLAECESTTSLRQLCEIFPHGDWLGKTAGIEMRDDISGELTLAFTILKIDEAGLKGQFDARVPICADDNNCRAVIQSKLEQMGFAVEGKMSAAHHTPEDSPFVKTLLKCYEQYTGNKGECLSMGGGTYVHNIEGGVAFGASMPGFESNLHGADERVSISDLLTACKIFAQVIADMCL